jgi:hypothetical protein
MTAEEGPWQRLPGRVDRHPVFPILVTAAPACTESPREAWRKHRSGRHHPLLQELDMILPASPIIFTPAAGKFTGAPVLT